MKDQKQEQKQEPSPCQPPTPKAAASSQPKEQEAVASFEGEKGGMGKEEFEGVLNLAFGLGQRYWQDADSDSSAANSRSVKHLHSFNSLVQEARAAIEAVYYDHRALMDECAALVAHRNALEAERDALRARLNEATLRNEAQEKVPVEDAREAWAAITEYTHAGVRHHDTLDAFIAQYEHASATSAMNHCSACGTQGDNLVRVGERGSDYEWECRPACAALTLNTPAGGNYVAGSASLTGEDTPL